MFFVIWSPYHRAWKGFSLKTVRWSSNVWKWKLRHLGGEGSWGAPCLAKLVLKAVELGGVQCGAPKIAKLVQITPITMVYGTQITIVMGVYKPTDITVVAGTNWDQLGPTGTNWEIPPISTYAWNDTLMNCDDSTWSIKIYVVVWVGKLPATFQDFSNSIPSSLPQPCPPPRSFTARSASPAVAAPSHERPCEEDEICPVQREMLGRSGSIR